MDNASTDRTAEVSRQWIEQRSHFRYVREEKLGLSHAQQRCRGQPVPYLAYLDDDARGKRLVEADCCACSRGVKRPPLASAAASGSIGRRAPRLAAGGALFLVYLRRLRDGGTSFGGERVPSGRQHGLSPRRPA